MNRIRFICDICQGTIIFDDELISIIDTCICKDNKIKNKGKIIVLALENMIPKKPIKKRYVDYEDLKNLLIGKCQVCRWEVACYQKYCSNCGQKLDWDTTRYSKDLYTEYWD